MGIVTIEARTILERFVLDLPGHEILGVVTVRAELGILCDRFERLVLRWRGVTGFAVGLDHGVVSARLQERGLLGAVRIVADRAGALFDGILAMRLSERRLVALVARNAERRWSHGEEIRLRGGMGEVASRASLFLKHLVRNPLAVILLLVALEADRIALGTEEIR
jgi:hypothetical protein